MAVRLILARVTGRGGDTVPIDPLNDELIPLSQAARSLPSKPGAATLWRWHRRGVKGVKLEIVRVGGRVFTTASAWRDFVTRMTSRPDNTTEIAEPDERSEGMRQRLRDEGLA